MTNEEQAKTMTPEQKVQYGDFLFHNGVDEMHCVPDVLDAMHLLSQAKQAEIDRLQAIISDSADKLLEQEQRFNRIAENEAKRMIDFGEAILKQADSEIMDIRVIATKSNSHSGDYAENLLYTLQTNICEIDLKQLYINLKKV